MLSTAVGWVAVGAAGALCVRTVLDARVQRDESHETRALLLLAYATSTKAIAVPVSAAHHALTVGLVGAALVYGRGSGPRPYSGYDVRSESFSRAALRVLWAYAFFFVVLVPPVGQLVMLLPGTVLASTLGVYLASVVLMTVALDNPAPVGGIVSSMLSGSVAWNLMLMAVLEWEPSYRYGDYWLLALLSACIIPWMINFAAGSMAALFTLLRHVRLGSRS